MGDNSRTDLRVRRISLEMPFITEGRCRAGWVNKPGAQGNVQVEIQRQRHQDVDSFESHETADVLQERGAVRSGK